MSGYAHKLLYDIMSAYPLITKKQLQKQKIKMAMALKGKSNHYLWHNVQRRHFIETAKAANFSPEKAENILNDMLDNIDKVIASVSAKIPKKFPEEIARSIFTGMREMKLQLSK